MDFTNEQELAVSVMDRPLLISAAAGSGKTRVLVERLMRRVYKGADIDRFLVITFTRAAAGELRDRILQGLNQLLADHPEDSRRLQKQIDLCSRADIGTIDSICGRILREYVHLSPLPADFRIADSERTDELKENVLDRVLEERYQHILDTGDGSCDLSFRALADSVGAGRDDSRLAGLVLSFAETLSAHPDPEGWLDDFDRSLDTEGITDVTELPLPWARELLNSFGETASYWATQLEACLKLMKEPDNAGVAKAYFDGFAAAAEGFRDISSASSLGWELTKEKCDALHMKVGSCRAKTDVRDKDAIKAVWDEAKKAKDALEGDLRQSSAELLADLRSVAPAMHALVGLTKSFRGAYRAELHRQGLTDFSDQEHLVLELLSAHPEVAAELSSRWDEVMVDEYQDVNRCQDSLFRSLSGDGARLFCVGDAKQSIYRFRLADPRIFLDNYRRSVTVETADDPSREPGRILMGQNFRSSHAVLDATNFVFSNILSESLGEMEYDDSARLDHGRTEPADYAPPSAEILLWERGGEEDENKTLIEARGVAAKIRELVETKTLIPDGHGGLRELCWSDVAILLRADKQIGPYFRDALAAEGIPCTAARGGGFFRSLEITVLLSLLSVIDNPRQDIPLIAVLRSPLFGYTPDALASIRKRAPKADFYTALELAAKDDDAYLPFLEKLRRWRTLSSELSVSELLSLICAEENVPALLSAMKDAPMRRRNLRALEDYAVRFEEGGYRGLFRFVTWMRRLTERGEEPFMAPDDGDAVKLMTIHASKGLQFPVVFLASAGHQFNTSDLRAGVLLHQELGIGMKRRDTERGAEYPTLAYNALKQRKKRELYSEEMRLLYVAMTRAQERLYITAAVKDTEKLFASRTGVLPVNPVLLEKDRSMLDWLLRCALAEDSPFCVSVIPAGETAPESSAAAQPPLPEEMPPRTLGIREKLDWVYPWKGSVDLPSKVTASAGRAGELRDEEARDGSPLPPPEDEGEKEEFVRPLRQLRLEGRDRPLTGAERGTAVHLTLQFINYERCTSREDIVSEIERLRTLGHLTDQQAAAVDPELVLNFFRGEVGQRLLAGQVYREQRFTLLLPAGEYGGSDGDTVLLQGVVDCVLEEDGELTVVDYKTDYVTERTVDALVETYTPQVRTYARAVSRIRGKPVKEALLCFLRLGRAVKVEI